MNEQISRRRFIKQSSLVSACGVLGFAVADSFSLPAREAGQPAAPAHLKTSLNAFSFNKLLNDRIRDRGPGVTLLELLDFAAKCKFEGFDATGYYFPGYPKVPSDAYIKELRQKAADLGLGISGTGVRNN